LDDLVGDRGALGFARSASAIAEVATLSSVPLSKDAAKRRQLTVMFCDLVGSTAMSAWLGPRTCAASSGPSFHKPIARLDA
jgi:class 3 adenylate cyclase